MTKTSNLAHLTTCKPFFISKIYNSQSVSGISVLLYYSCCILSMRTEKGEDGGRYHDRSIRSKIKNTIKGWINCVVLGFVLLPLDTSSPAQEQAVRITGIMIWNQPTFSLMVSFTCAGHTEMSVLHWELFQNQLITLCSTFNLLLGSYVDGKSSSIYNHPLKHLQQLCFSETSLNLRKNLPNFERFLGNKVLICLKNFSYPGTKCLLCLFIYFFLFLCVLYSFVCL